MSTENATLESRDDFKDTPEGQYKYYTTELEAAQKSLKKWHKMADKIVDKFLGKAPANIEGQLDNLNSFKLNLFNSNVTTLASMMYGNTPKIDISRTFDDPNDDVARVAGETLRRLLTLDIQENGEEVDCLLQSALSDRLTVGLGCARVRYEVETNGKGEDAELVDERAVTEYYHWQDVLWGWARNWSELPWLAFRSYLTKDEVAARFGREAAAQVKLTQQKTLDTEESSQSDPDSESPWKKAEIWEIWDKSERKVVWLNIGGPKKLLDSKPDPLQLRGFFPAPPFLMANPTTTLYMPTPDYALAQDLYNEIDTLQARISTITEAVKVAGVYNGESEDIKKLMQTGQDNILVPVANWALFGERGGLQSQIEWIPIKEIADTLSKLVEMRNDAIGLLQQVTGMSDVMRGELGSAYEGVGQSEMKAKFGSVRVQALQDRFAKFATDLFQLKADIVSKHFSPETIAKRSNMQRAAPEDRDLLPQAIELIKSPAEAQFRIEIRPESVAMVDYAQLKSERTEALNSIATFMQSATPLIEADPAMKPFLLQLLQWNLAGFKGSATIEGVIDKAIEAAQKQPEQGDKPDPAMQAAQLSLQQEQLKQQGEQQKIQAKAQADMQIRQQDFDLDLQLAEHEHNMKMQEVLADMERSLAETRAKLEADLLNEQAQTQANLAQTQATIEGEIQKDVVTAQLDLATERGKTANKITEIETNARAKIAESKAKVSESTNGRGDSDGE